eukprot:scaffold234758_cov18-Tisochrysis_lutea.AAC.1
MQGSSWFCDARSVSITNVIEGVIIKKLKEKERKAMQAVKTLPTAIKEKIIPKDEAPCIPFTNLKKRKEEVNGGQ